MGRERSFCARVFMYVCVGFVLAMAPDAIAAASGAGGSGRATLSGGGEESIIEQLAGFIESSIRPAMQGVYKRYYDTIGGELSTLLWNSLDQREQKELDYKDVQARYPATAKRVYEKSVYGLYQVLQHTPVESINGSLQSGFDILGHAGRAVSEISPDHSPEGIVLQRVVEGLRPYMLDPDMRACLRGHILDVPIDNAFNTGCHIFITREVVRALSEDELMAVVAHEMGHSARGDSFDNFIVIARSMAEQSGLLLLDEANWFLTGQDYEHFKALQAGEFMDLILRSFGRQAEKIELMADLMGVRLLLSMGRSEESLVQALIHLTAGNSGVDAENAVRQYPSLQKRIVAIRAYAKHNGAHGL